MKITQKAFTLVELAIVITIIGLLIGGVLKGQELLENARMTSSASQLKAYDTGVLTFKDVYKAYPGDIANPSNFIQNCTTAPCNVSGNANGIIGNVDNWFAEENNNFWLHLAKAGLISGFDPNTTWNASTFFNIPPRLPLSGQIAPIYWNAHSAYTAMFGTNMMHGHWWHSFTYDGTGQGAPGVKHNTIAKFDLKIDDGKPETGSVRLLHLAVGNVYDPDNSNLSYFTAETGF